MVKIVTDSVSDLAPEVAEDLGIAVVPLIVRFGTESFRDGVDLTNEQFYERLKNSPVLPVTSAPTPGAFAETCDRLAEETDEIAIIALSSRLSATHDVARQGVELMKRQCRVEVVDSRCGAMAEGFVAIRAAEAARAGASLDDVAETARRTAPRASIFAAFETLEYLRKGGRIGAAQALLGSLLKVNPIIALKDGVVVPAGRARSRQKALDRLFGYAAAYSRVEELAVEDAACPDEAEALAQRLGSAFPGVRIHRSHTTPVIGTHTGPGLLVVAVLGDS